MLELEEERLIASGFYNSDIESETDDIKEIRDEARKVKDKERCYHFKTPRKLGQA
jgi:hypothetical protein